MRAFLRGMSHGMQSLFKGIYIGKLFDIPIYAGISLLFVIAFTVSATIGTGDIRILLALVAIYFIVLAHEFGHMLTAKHYGIKVGSIHLSILGGRADAQTNHDTDSHHMFWIVVNGPMVNIILGLLCVPFTLFIHPFISEVTWFLHINIILALFNLLPISPMDGGRLLYTMVIRSFAKTMKSAAYITAITSYIIGLIVICICIHIGFLWPAIVLSFVLILTTLELAGSLEHCRIVRLLDGFDQSIGEAWLVLSEDKRRDLVELYNKVCIDYGYPDRVRTYPVK